MMNLFIKIMTNKIKLNVQNAFRILITGIANEKNKLNIDYLYF